MEEDIYENQEIHELTYSYLYENFDSVINKKELSNCLKIKEITDITFSLLYGVVEQLTNEFSLPLNQEQQHFLLYRLLSTVFSTGYPHLAPYGEEQKEIEDFVEEEEINVLNKYQQEKLANIYLEYDKIKLLQHE